MRPPRAAPPDPPAGVSAAVLPSVAVLGSGSWGTALATLIARNGHATTIWGRDAAQVASIRDRHENTRYLPGIPLPESLAATGDLGAAVAGADLVLVVTPSHAFNETLHALAPHRRAGAGVAWATKGFEPGSGRFLHEVAGEVLGAELGGAMKNVLAVATGVADGMQLGLNARAGLITRGLNEMLRLNLALGGRSETRMGLAGLGDLVLTCTGDLSRNRRLGLALGRGQSIGDAVAAIGQVVESVQTADEVMRLGDRHGVDLPISSLVQAVLHERISPAEGVKLLLSREQKPEYPEGLFGDRPL